MNYSPELCDIMLYGRKDKAILNSTSITANTKRMNSLFLFICLFIYLVS